MESYIEDIFVFLGPLHLEKVALTCLGDLIKGTGIEDVLGAAGLSSVGIKVAMCDVNHIIKARYAAQIISLVLQAHLEDAFDVFTDGNLSMPDWIKEMAGTSTTFKYYYGILEHIKHINVFIRSLREADFLMFISFLEKLCPLLFALDHYQYSRWLPVLIHDLKLLKIKDPKLFGNFMKGFFVAKKTSTQYSKIGFDQVLEQFNEKIKSSSGITDLLNKEDKEFMRKVEHVLPEIQDYLERVETNDQKVIKHKEEMDSFIKKIISDCLKVYKAISSNPFSLTQPKRLILMFYYRKLL